MKDFEENVNNNYLFIDYENIQPLSFDIVKNYPFKVILFIGSNQKKIPIDLVTAMHSLGKNAKYVQIEGSGKNALYFHLAFYLGMLLEKDPKSYFHILSKDSGFDILIKHLKRKKVFIQRYNSLNDIPILQVSNSEIFDEKIKLIVDYLAKRGNAKPKKIETLLNTIDCLFRKSLTKEELQGLVKKLTTLKLITIEQTKVNYNLSNT